MKLIHWELNEVNFDYLCSYIKDGYLPVWKDFIDKHGIVTTYSESVYENLEPWIQWPSIRTGKSFSEHKIFRLGDIEKSDYRQHWEILENKGFCVAAVSPINAWNNTNNSPFWIPDPWVKTKVSGSNFLVKLSNALSQVINDNSHNKITLLSLITLSKALMLMGTITSLPIYIRSIIGIFFKHKWSKAILLDRLLADVFKKLWLKHTPDFSVIFLNSAAHIQHHYMCNSSCYDGSVDNPEWYIDSTKDPLLEIYQSYESILKDLLELDCRLIISTGLSQVPHEKPLFYWRLKNHSQFLSKVGISYESVVPRMTRDFLIKFNSNNSASDAKLLLSRLVDENGHHFFDEIDDRGNELFVTLSYDGDITKDTYVFLDRKCILDNFFEHVSFVAIKNGEHSGKGYYIDTCNNENIYDSIPITNIFDIILKHFNVNKKDALS